MDDYYWNDHDCHGAWQCVWRKVGGSGQAVSKDSICGNLDCGHTVAGLVSDSGDIRRGALSAGIFVLCACLGANASFAFWEDDLTYEGESIYNYLQVKDRPDRTVLSTNVLFGVQSVYMKSESLTGMYYDYAMAAPLMSDVDEVKDERMLILGMGTGTYAKQCRRFMGVQDISGVEINQKITDLSRKIILTNW